MKRFVRAMLALGVAGGSALAAFACSSFDGEPGSPTDIREAAVDAPVAPDGSDAREDASGDGGAPLPCEQRCLSHHCEEDGGCDPLVFITTRAYRGDFADAGSTATTGLERADEICTREAGDAGVFRAWLSTTEELAQVRVSSTPPTRPLYLPDGVKLAGRVDQLLDGGPLVPLNTTLALAPIPEDQDVWTGTTATGSPALDTCTTWSTHEGSSAAYGRPVKGAEWTFVNKADCGFSMRLYCFEIVR